MLPGAQHFDFRGSIFANGGKPWLDLSFDFGASRDVLLFWLQQLVLGEHGPEIHGCWVEADGIMDLEGASGPETGALIG